MGKRRKARELAMQILFQLDNRGVLYGNNSKEQIDLFWQDTLCKQEIKEFSQNLVLGTIKELIWIEKYIIKYAENWDLLRMPGVDRNILRLATYEMLYMEDIPIKVTINEAIDIAKNYGTDDSARFINGLLDKISKNLPKEILGKKRK